MVNLMVKVAIILSFHRFEVAHLIEQIHSVCNQCIHPNTSLEVVLLHDQGDCLAFPQQLFQFRALFPSISFVFCSTLGNMGIHGAFMFGFESISCGVDVVFLCDQDDVWKPEKIESHLKIYKAHPRVTSITNDALIKSVADPSVDNANIRLSKFEALKMYYQSAWIYKAVIGCCTSVKITNLNRVVTDFCNANVSAREAYGCHDVCINDINILFGQKILVKTELQDYIRRDYSFSSSMTSSTAIVENNRFYYRSHFLASCIAKHGILRRFVKSGLLTYLVRVFGIRFVFSNIFEFLIKKKVICEN